MNVFEFARNKEKLAEGSYRRLAEAAPSEGFKSIFIRLADAEKHHYEIILKMEMAEGIEFLNSDILNYAQEDIRKMKSRDEKFKLAGSQIELYKEAQALEVEAEKLYLEHAQKSTNEHQRKVLKGLAFEEHQHYLVLEHIIEFTTFPATYPENAEFNNPPER